MTTYQSGMLAAYALCRADWMQCNVHRLQRIYIQSGLHAAFYAVHLEHINLQLGVLP